MVNVDGLYSPVEVAEVLGVTQGTLARWRRKQIGPEWSRIGERFIRYRCGDLLNWLAPMPSARLPARSPRDTTPAFKRVLKDCKDRGFE